MSREKRVRNRKVLLHGKHEYTQSFSCWFSFIRFCFLLVLKKCQRSWHSAGWHEYSQQTVLKSSHYFSKLPSIAWTTNTKWYISWQSSLSFCELGLIGRSHTNTRIYIIGCIQIHFDSFNMKNQPSAHKHILRMQSDSRYETFIHNDSQHWLLLNKKDWEKKQSHPAISNGFWQGWSDCHLP